MATIKIEGRRCWIKTQYGEACVPALKNLGVHWDSNRKEWWITSAKQAEVETIIGKPGAQQPSQGQQEAMLERDRNNMLGRCQYNGKSYYIVGHGSNDKGEWLRLMFRDGSKTFFKSYSDINQSTISMYSSPKTLKGLQEYAARMKREASGGPCECWCHTARNPHCSCETSGFCSYHHDGCDSCGCER